jgi:hypothetical protein
MIAQSFELRSRQTHDPVLNLRPTVTFIVTSAVMRSWPDLASL